MGVYINMEMPTSCAFCRFSGAYCYAKGDEDAHSTLPCPLIPIQPHGRLGDLDELHKEAVRRSEKAGTYDSWYNCMDRVISAFDIEKAPTIIPASEEGET